MCNRKMKYYSYLSGLFNVCTGTCVAIGYYGLDGYVFLIFSTRLAIVWIKEDIPSLLNFLLTKSCVYYGMETLAAACNHHNFLFFLLNFIVVVPIFLYITI